MFFSRFLLVLSRESGNAPQAIYIVAVSGVVGGSTSEQRHKP